VVVLWEKTPQFKRNELMSALPTDQRQEFQKQILLAKDGALQNFFISYIYTCICIYVYMYVEVLIAKSAALHDF